LALANISKFLFGGNVRFQRLAVEKIWKTRFSGIARPFRFSRRIAHRFAPGEARVRRNKRHWRGCDGKAAMSRKYFSKAECLRKRRRDTPVFAE
jgi:hypothetical protein